MCEQRQGSEQAALTWGAGRGSRERTLGKTPEVGKMFRGRRYVKTSQMRGQVCLNHDRKYVENNNNKQSWCRRCHWQLVIPLPRVCLELGSQKKSDRTLGQLDRCLGWIWGGEDQFGVNGKSGVS